MVGNRALTALYWVIGFVLAVLAGVAGASWGNSQAPTFGNDETGGTPATGASRLLFSLFGGLLAAAAVLAVFAGIFMLLWLRGRRGHGTDDDYEADAGFMDHVEFGDDEDDEDEDAMDGDAAEDGAGDDSYDDGYDTDGYDTDDYDGDGYEDAEAFDETDIGDESVGGRRHP